MLNFISKVIKSHPIGQAFGLQGQQVAWKKVKDLKTGTMIAVENNGHLDWDEIVSIKKVSRKRVYDIEVEKTHNFVANGIVAHNTYISGNVGIGVTSPTARLSIGGTSSVISNLVGDITITPASNLIISQGNVGIGTSSPTQILDVNGSINIGGSLAIGSIGSTTDNNRVLTSSAAGSGIVQYLDTTSWDKNAADDVWALAASLGTAQVISTGNTASFIGFNGIGTSISGTDQLSIGLGGTLTQNTKLSVGNTAAFFINSTSGYIGIGISNPTSILTTNGDITGNKFIDYQNGLYFLDPAIADSLSSSLSLTSIGSIKWNAKYSGSSWSNISSGYAASKIENGVRGLLLSIGNTGFGGTITSWNTNLFLAGNGRVGIGTSSPAYTLEVIGNGRVSSALTVGTSLSVGTTSYTGSLNINKTTAVGGSYVAAFVGTGSTGFIGYLDTGAWDKVATDDHTVATNGLQEIGTSSVGLGGTLTQTSFTNINIGTGSSGLSILGLNNNTQALTIRQNGNVGIGTTSPLSLTHIYASSSNIEYLTIQNSSVNPSAGSGIRILRDAGNSEVGKIWTSKAASFDLFIDVATLDDTADLFLRTRNGANSVVLTGSGNFGIGTTNPTYKLHVNGYASIVGELNMNNFYITNGTQPGNSNFIGGQAGYQATNAIDSNFIGRQAGYQATNATYSVFLGTAAGQSATDAQRSVFLGQGAGQSATSASYSNFIGFLSGVGASNAFDSNFLGREAGSNATNANNSNFLGQYAGFQATSANNSNFLGTNAGLVATSASNSNFFGYQAGLGATNANNSNFLGENAGYQATNAYFSNFLGYQAGNSATSASNSNFFGSQAGYPATNAYYSNFFGNQAGYQATNAYYSNFFGSQAGYQATNAYYSNFFGQQAGRNAFSARNSTFIGDSAGNNAISASYSLILGDGAGYNAQNASNSIFIGTLAGYNDTVNNGTTGTSIAIGRYAGTGGFRNSIAIGRGVLNSGTTQANIGNVLYLNGIYNSDTRSSTPTANGRVGIGINNPTYKIQVNGQPAANGYTAWTNYSDQRLKTNIQKLSGNYLDKIMLLDPVTFNYNDTYYSQTNYSRPVGEIPTYTGFIAQDLQKIFPEMVGMSENGYLDTNLGNLQLYLIKGIQEQQAQISTISARLDNVFISDIGQVAINYNVSDEVLATLGYSGTKNEIEAATYSLTDATGNAVTRVGQYGKLAAAKIETAYLSAKSIVVDNLAARRIASETIITGEITGTEALFDSATIGSLTAGSIGASEASFSTVYADQIINPEGNISEVLATKISDLRDEIKSMIASSSAEATPSAIAIESETWDTPLATESADLALDNLTLSDSLVIASQLTVGGHSSLSSVNVTGTLTVGQIAFNDNIIETTAEALYIQPSGLGSVHILNDRLVLSSDGSVTINGNLNVTGSLIAQMLKAEEIETKKLTTEKINIILPAQTAELLAGPVIASDSAAISPIIASALPAEVSTQAGTLASNATVGTVTLAAGQTEITIQNPSLTANSMVYLTPNGSTDNQVVYIKSKSVADPLISPTPSAFTIAIDQPLTQNVDINWWLIN